MRRRISLYIGNELADLDEQSFILFNYTMEDLTNPTIAKNSFSQQITLKGTPANNRIFGSYFRPDRKTLFGAGEAGPGFNPAVKTPFVIYNEMSEVVESGYCKLDNVIRKGADVQYKVSLYGGLGSFLFSLSYSETGQKRTLADLDFLGNGDPDELNFVINAQTVEDAWTDLSTMYNGGDPGTIWKIINFCPAYQGYPNNFSADKAVARPGQVGLRDPIGAYQSKSGYCLITLAQKQDEWAAKDIRSYLQRPVLSMDALLEAICNPDNNGGYTVDISSIATIPYSGLWMTLPDIPSLGSFKHSTEGLSLTLLNQSYTDPNQIGRYNLVGSVPSGSLVEAVIKCKVRMNMPSGANSYTTLRTSVTDSSGNNKGTAILAQMVACASDNTIVGGSNVKVWGMPKEQLANAKKGIINLGFSPAFATDEYVWVDNGTASKVTTGIFEFDNEIPFRVEGQDVAYYKLMVYVYTFTSTLHRGNRVFTFAGDGSTSKPTMYASFSTSFNTVSSYIVNGSGNTVSMTDPASLRSGALITKQMLLSTSATPAEYLLSFCKIFGLYILTDQAAKKVTIVPRNTLYQNETVDLTGRVDVSQDREYDPIVYDSKWYKFALEGVGGAFFDEYLDVEGIEYGIQLVDTGYDFDADVKDLLDGNVFKNACTVLAHSRYFNYIDHNGVFLPSPFLDSGNTYTLWDLDGETLESPVPCPPTAATITYYNAEYNGYDIANQCKLQLADAEGKPVDGKDILVFLNGFDFYAHFKITDDIPVMSVVNGGVPCWILDDGPGVLLPIFSRYRLVYNNPDYVMDASLDFGVPRQLDMPGIVYDPDSTVYAKAWRAYLSDRYDVDTKVMRCKVDFRGMQVGQGLLRKFYYFDNCIWVLNKITNYSLTTYDLTECEFIMVQRTNNYLTGQDY